MDWLLALPWPSFKQIFTSICLGLITGTVTTFILTPWRSYSGIWWRSKEDRVFRRLIINAHIRNDHTAKLRFCRAGACSQLSRPKQALAQLTSSSAGAVEATLHP